MWNLLVRATQELKQRWQRTAIAVLMREWRSRDSNSFAYVIVGAGSAGCVLANGFPRSEHSVALIEAGERTIGSGSCPRWLSSSPSAIRAPMDVPHGARSRAERAKPAYRAAKVIGGSSAHLPPWSNRRRRAI